MEWALSVGTAAQVELYVNPIQADGDAFTAEEVIRSVMDQALPNCACVTGQG